MKIYVASSWRNTLHPEIVVLLRSEGHEVYNFRHPTPDTMGFGWSEIDPEWKGWTPRQYREALEHPVARRGFSFDMNALRQCEACLLVLPSGRSASWEFGWALGAGKIGAVAMFQPCEPELMYLGNQILTSTSELIGWSQSLNISKSV